MNSMISLVTICVLTYNSSESVLETLESIKSQTYMNLQLVISDDSSADSTVEKCRTWLNENKERFSSVEILTSDVNTGVTANCNRAVRASKGRWVKFIAGDDVLYSDSVERLIRTAESYTYDKYFFGGFVQPFSQTGELSRDYGIEHKLSDFGSIVDPSIQLEILRCNNYIYAPTVLFPAAVFSHIMFDEDYPFAEDYPMFLNMLNAGYRYININEPLVRYRIHSLSISNNGRDEKLFTSFYLKKRILEINLQLPYVGFAVRSKLKHDYNVRLLMDKIGLNRNNIFCQILFSICLRINPFFYIGRWYYENKLAKYK